MDFSKPSAFPPKSGSFLAQNKIPREMLASYRPQNDFEPAANDFQQMAFDPTQAMMSQYYSYYQYQNHYLEPFVDPNTPYSSKFPRARDYNSEQSIIEAFPHLEGVNDANFNIESVSPHAQFYIMRSGNDDNIHKAIKYHIWTTTTIGKNALRQAWQEFLDKGLEPEIYLVFSVVNSNQFLGVAKMTSTVNDDDTFKYWWEPCKWFGTVQVKWLFIKDIPHAHFEHITEGDYSASVITSRDSTPISADSGKMILQTFKDYPSRPNIFESFDYMDRREDYIRSERDSNPEFQKFFDNCCQAYKNDPESVQPQRKPYYPKKSSKRSNYPTKKYNSSYYREKTTFHKKGENPQATRANTNASDEGHYVLRKDKPNHRERNQRNERKKIDVGGPEDYPDLEEANRLNKNAKHSNGYHTKKQNGLNGHAKEHAVENGESADIKTN